MRVAFFFLPKKKSLFDGAARTFELWLDNNRSVVSFLYSFPRPTRAPRLARVYERLHIVVRSFQRESHSAGGEGDSRRCVARAHLSSVHKKSSSSFFLHLGELESISFLQIFTGVKKYKHMSDRGVRVVRVQRAALAPREEVLSFPWLRRDSFCFFPITS